MNRFDLFTMIFYVLDFYWDKNGGEELGNFLSAMSPFTFDGIGSADPAVYEEFCDFVNKESIEIDESYDIAVKYVNNQKRECITNAFVWVTREDWAKKCNSRFS